MGECVITFLTLLYSAVLLQNAALHVSINKQTASI